MDPGFGHILLCFRNKQNQTTFTSVYQIDASMPYMEGYYADLHRGSINESSFLPNYQNKSLFCGSAQILAPLHLNELF